MSPGLDIITVPDFSNGNYLFVARTLFFLSSYMEWEKKKPHTLHLVCIGDPPKVVEKMARQAGALIHTRPPMDGAGFLNKLRGLEIPGHHNRYLLLDTDILFF